MSKSDSGRTISIIPVYHDSGNIQKVLRRFPDKVVDEICLVVDCATKEESEEIT
jgi:hypothetical protein